MPHTSHNKKPTRKKRTQIVDENGWTRVSSHHLSTAPCNSRSDRADQPGYDSHELRVDPLPVADGMTEERLVERYNVIEQKWLASESHKQLSKAVHAALQTLEIEIRVCACFGTGTMSGVRDGWIARHDVALYQIAAFKSVVDAIGTIQSFRPVAYAQEPNYNMLDAALLNYLGMTKVDSPNGFEVMSIRSQLESGSNERHEDLHPASFTYCPGAEQDVLVRALQKNPALCLGGDLERLRDRQATYLSTIFTDSKATENPFGPTQKELQITVQMIDTFIAEHNKQKLPDLDAPDFPFHEEALYWRKPDAAATLVNSTLTSTE